MSASDHVNPHQRLRAGDLYSQNASPEDIGAYEEHLNLNGEDVPYGSVGSDEYWESVANEVVSGEHEITPERIGREGVQKPVHVVGTEGWIKHVVDGHHRIAAANLADPDMEIPVRFWKSSQEAHKHGIPDHG